MSLIVQKFGGTSVGSVEKIKAAAVRAIAAQDAGSQVVVVVSAMGKETDRLIDLAASICDDPPPREMDMLLSTGEQVSVALLAMAIQAEGRQAVSQTGFQVGIQTDRSHTKARIRSIPAERLRNLLGGGAIIVAAGFQGVDEDLNITTLGRGGSDTSAVALAAALGADKCEIYTDVEGVLTTDPRVVPEARRLERISYDEMLELASLGAGVMHNRSIEFAKKFGVPVYVRHSGKDAPGTLIGSQSESNAPVTGAALVRDEARLTVQGVPDRPGAIASIFDAVARRNIPVDMIVQNVAADGLADVSFTVAAGDLAATLTAAQAAAKELDAEDVEVDADAAKVSVVGAAMASTHGVARHMFEALAAADVNMDLITTSEIKISVLVRRDRADDALRLVHRAFHLHQPPAADQKVSLAEHLRRPPEEVLASLQQMEDLVIEGVSLDDSQGRVTIDGLPDEPGAAAQVFAAAADAGVFVDMIVQSTGREGRATLSFTTPTAQLDRAITAVEPLAKKWCDCPVRVNRNIAKLSIGGIGLRSHADFAVRAFHALSNAGVNIEMVNTSEVRVNVVVDAPAGEKALASLQEAFTA